MTGRPNDEVKIYERYLRDFYPTSKTPEVLFLAANRHWEGGRNDRGKELMIELIKNFPNHHYAKDAEIMLPDMDKSHDEWMMSKIAM